MEWTSEKPIVAGWYWWKHNADVDHEIVRIVDVPIIGLLQSRMFTNTAEKVMDMHGHWAGPLAAPPPTDTKGET